jgi:hypothetical protein
MDVGGYSIPFRMRELRRDGVTEVGYRLSGFSVFEARMIEGY